MKIPQERCIQTQTEALAPTFLSITGDIYRRVFAPLSSMRRMVQMHGGGSSGKCAQPDKNYYDVERNLEEQGNPYGPFPTTYPRWHVDDAKPIRKKRKKPFPPSVNK